MNNNRVLGRAFDQIRPLEIVKNFTTNSDGSILLTIGRTIVLCTVNIIEGVPDFIRGKGKSWITAEYSMLPSSTNIRTTRESVDGKQTGRTHEIQRFIGRSLRSMFNLNDIGEITIKVDCDVIQADGGTRCASITGSYIAVVDALSCIYKKNKFTNFNILEKMGAISVGISNNNLLLDMDYLEDYNCDADMNVVMTSKGEFIEIQVNAEKKKIDRETFNMMLSLAEKGIYKLISFY